MKITYATSYTLADTSASVYFAEGDAGNERQVQQEPLLRAASQFVQTRSNQKQEFTFTVTRLHALVTDAELFYLTHGSALPDTGSLVFTADAEFVPAGSPPSTAPTATWATATLKSVRVRYKGRTTITTYTFTGAAIAEDSA